MGIQFSGLASGLDTDNIIKELMKAERMKVDKVKKEKTKLEWTKDIWKEMNTKLYSFYTKQVFKLKSKGTFMQKTATSSNESLISAKASINVAEGTHTIKVTQLAKGSFLTGDKIEKDKDNKDIDVTALTKISDLIDFGTSSEKTIHVNANGGKVIDVTISEDDNIAQVVSKMNEKAEDVNISFDSNFKRIMMSSKEQGEGINIQVGGDSDLIKALGLENKIATIGQDSKFTYNETELQSNSNEVTINGLTLDFKGLGTSNITVNQDTQVMYDTVKEFITDYNKLIVEINEKIYAEKATGYEPLTQEEKKSMSEDDVKLWEGKIKDSLLRRDNILTGLIESMRGIVGSSLGVDASKSDYRYLSDLGIVTGEYTEKGVLHIGGDEDDPLYAIKKNKLKEAIESNPDEVTELLTAIGDKLYSTMQEKMGSTKVSSALTFFNDKSIDTKLDDYEDRIDELEDRLTVTEKRYYQQFTAMEKAIQMMNNQSASLASMLGGGQ